ncbi:hypothetical protein [Allostreptomyces psammosilenae]|uniref:Uncharacterized protein n=1 Tax=Allostreptomyces psammosilenae TaxID=1892865 RepID=A0A852ZM91_9ACTN|nr:hypothetical protein [Allostreptomyces psammosilenae]NYI03536.1 hypothetical protein [Allostreptomyces psammosilenae]
MAVGRPGSAHDPAPSPPTDPMGASAPGAGPGELLRQLHAARRERRTAAEREHALRQAVDVRRHYLEELARADRPSGGDGTESVRTQRELADLHVELTRVWEEHARAADRCAALERWIAEAGWVERPGPAGTPSLLEPAGEEAGRRASTGADAFHAPRRPERTDRTPPAAAVHGAAPAQAPDPAPAAVPTPPGAAAPAPSPAAGAPSSPGALPVPAAPSPPDAAPTGRGGRGGRGRTRPSRPRGARFHGGFEEDEVEGPALDAPFGLVLDGHPGDAAGQAPDSVPLTAEPVAVAPTPRGARFHGSAGGTGGAGSADGTGRGGGAARRTVAAESLPGWERARQFAGGLAELRAQGRSEAVHALLWETAGWPAEHVPALVVALERNGRPDDVTTLLWEAASRGAEQIATIVVGLHRVAPAGHADSLHYLLAQTASRPPRELAAVLAALGVGGVEAGELLRVAVGTRNAEEIAGLVEHLVEEGREEELNALLTAAVRAEDQERYRDIATALRRRGLPEEPGAGRRRGLWGR